MRILQVIPHLSKGGAERVVVELANALAERGHDVTVLVAFPVDFELNQKDLKETIHVEYVSAKQQSRYLKYPKLLVWVLVHWKSLKKFDVIHCHLTFGLVFGLLISIRRKFSPSQNLRLIATCHMVGGGVSRTYRYFNRRISYVFDAFVLMAQDDYWREFISKENRTNIHVVANGISPNARISNDMKRVPDPFFNIGTISRLNAERKPWLFLEVFSEILKSDPDGKYKFILGGEGSEKERLEQIASQLGLTQSLTFTGLVKEPNEFFVQLDLYISLNVEGISGIAGLEAVFAGLPVVAIQLSTEYTQGANDWIWSDPDTKKVARKIIEFRRDPQKRDQEARNQLEIANAEFSTGPMIEAYQELYCDQKSSD